MHSYQGSTQEGGGASIGETASCFGSNVEERENTRIEKRKKNTSRPNFNFKFKKKNLFKAFES